MEFTAAQIASFINGKILGDENASITGVSPIENAQNGQLSFVSQEKFAEFISLSEASVIIVSEKFVKEENYKPTLIVVEDAYLAFQVLMNLYQQMREEKKSGIEQPSTIADSATIGENVYVGAHSYISDKSKIGNGTQIFPQVYIGKNVKIGENSIIYSGARIYDYCVVGDNCIIHSNTVVGSDGFGFQPTKDGYQKIPQLGNVILEDNVEIGACTTVDRATLGSTIIRKGVKLDNHIQVAHNVEIGENTVIAAQTGIAGTTKIGKNGLIGGQVGFAGHLVIGDNVKIQAQSGIGKNLADGEVVQGSPAFNYGDFAKSFVHFRNLPKIVADLEELKNNNNK